MFSLLARQGEHREPSKDTMADEEILEIEDGSNDKAYFTMVPNIVLNHSSANDQALYMQMKRFAGEQRGGGLCTASKRTLKEKLKIGHKALNESIKYLVDHGWIELRGERVIMTPGGPQGVEVYRVNDIWKLNADHYKGGSQSTPLSSKGGSESIKGGSRSNKGGSESASTKNYIKQIEPSELEDEIREVFSSDEDEEKKPKDGRRYTKSYDELCSWMEKLTGVRFVDVRGQYKALKLAREADISKDRLKQRAEELWHSGRFEKEGMDWFNVTYSFNKKS